ncbi:DUF222 domain-containing protein [Pseudolysinimonas sp.]|uniref:HNH endonuclease signature motif containing protein n=1 Tax=Pseudolysinimonas sp. TaxID=2680009 RepID=UPI00286C5A49|nr:DUF222 domain-containing protein [Pseudolysinimonas sp.]
MSPSAPAVTWLGADPRVLDDDALLTGARELGELRRLVEASLGSFAAEVKHRSRRQDGFGGLAQRLGAGTPEKLVEQVSGVSKRESQTLVRVGELLTVDADPWLAAVGTGVAAGRVSIVKADVIKSGLGAPSEDVAADDLADAAARLVALAPSMSVEKLAARARELRDDLDSAGVRDRERMLRDKRYLTLTPLTNGMTQLSGLLDPASAAIVSAAYDAATSPRRGGPRFTDDASKERAEKLVADERSLGQISLDTFVDLIRIGTEVDPGRLLGARRHAVRVLVTDQDLRERRGPAFLQDQTEAISIATAEQHVCDTGIVPIHFTDDGEPLRLGVTRRLFSSKQRDALAARDGGCRFPNCERPASWCEAHHRIPWKEGGPTDTRDGVLLCRHHHMLVHDNGWAIDRHPVHGLVAIPPRSIDPAQRPIPMPARSRAAQRLTATARVRR